MFSVVNENLNRNRSSIFFMSGLRRRAVLKNRAHVLMRGHGEPNPDRVLEWQRSRRAPVASQAVFVVADPLAGLIEHKDQAARLLDLLDPRIEIFQTVDTRRSTLIVRLFPHSGEPRLHLRA